MQDEAFLLPSAPLLLLLPAKRGSCLSSPGVRGVPVGLDKLWLNFLLPFEPLAPCWCTMLRWQRLVIDRIQPQYFEPHKSHHNWCATTV